MSSLNKGEAGTAALEPPRFFAYPLGLLAYSSHLFEGVSHSSLLPSELSGVCENVLKWVLSVPRLTRWIQARSTLSPCKEVSLVHYLSSPLFLKLSTKGREP